MADDAIAKAISAGDKAEAEGRYDDALSHFRTAVQQADDAADGRIILALNGLGNVLEETGNYDEAAKQLTRAVSIAQDALGPDHLLVARSLNNLALTLRLLGNPKDARTHLERALEIAQSADSRDDIIAVLNTLALVDKDEGKTTAAEERYTKVVALLEERDTPEDLDLASALGNLGDLYRQQEREDDAKAPLKRAYDIASANAPGSPTAATMANNLALYHEAVGDYVAAIPLFEEALEIWEDALGADHPNTGATLLNLGNVLRKQGRYDDAEPKLRRALKIFETSLGESNPRVAATLDCLADLLEWTDRDDEAKEARERAEKIRG